MVSSILHLLAPSLGLNSARLMILLLPRPEPQVFHEYLPSEMDATVAYKEAARYCSKVSCPIDSSGVGSHETKPTATVFLHRRRPF